MPVLAGTPVPQPARRGVAAVEFALVVPVLLVMMLGMIEMVGAIFARTIVIAAARRGCETATKPLSSNATVIFAVNDVISSNNISSSSATTTIRVNGVVKNVSTAKQNDRISVTVSIPYSNMELISSNLFIDSSTAISETVVMMRQQ